MYLVGRINQHTVTTAFETGIEKGAEVLRECVAEGNTCLMWQSAGHTGRSNNMYNVAEIQWCAWEPCGARAGKPREARVGGLGMHHQTTDTELDTRGNDHRKSVYT